MVRKFSSVFMFLCNSTVNISTSLLLYIRSIFLFLHLSLYLQFSHYKRKPYYPVILFKISKIYTHFLPPVSIHIPLSNQISHVCRCIFWCICVTLQPVLKLWPRALKTLCSINQCVPIQFCIVHSLDLLPTVPYHFFCLSFLQQNPAPLLHYIIPASCLSRIVY